MAKKIIRYLICDIIASIFLAVSIDCFAVAADFAPGGTSGLAVMVNYLLDFPIGWVTVVLNVPIILFTFKKLGLPFFLASITTILINSLFTDYVVSRFPVFTGARIWAAVLAGVCAGIGYSIIFNEGSSTGGTDFIIVALKQKHPKTSFGVFCFIIDGSVILLSIFVYGEPWPLLYGAVYTLVCSLCMDGTTKLIQTCSAHRQDKRKTDVTE